ncbi:MULTISPECIES: methionine ABC transporter ATP-binding protein [Alteribacter]|uniref:Methionine ABC transporter ATP-binding protein n=1 Tax=Alteribacter keqinensis TaxID=2483800 RepID=A0A3M7TT20_9BACI|nr:MULTISPECIES: methionine ABC transporter ATP-binding protein [Alteribacter]MBM7095497.1 methionine ABC transporter ATP-binding protein [Alteribacter salitolerans]RNA67902.1 methionine ABC transporter ATP-binding protein [Alteribacter keqinensis]
MITFDNVSKAYEGKEGTVTAVKDVSFTVNKGDIFGVIGFSGAGKSTLVRCVNLLEEPTAGEVRVNGRDMKSLSAKELREARKKIGMIFQHFNLCESKTVYANIAISLQLSKTPKAKVEKRVKELLSFVGLSDKAESYPDQLSGGQKQRVGIARALATSPEVLLCDEATSALDPQTTKAILELLKKVNREFGITILIITHEMPVIRDICNRVAVMENGEVIESGSVFDVFSRPQAKTTKNFVSSVMQDKLPASVLTHLQTDGKNHHIYRILFEGEMASQPVLSKVGKQFDLEVNVLHGHITELQEKPFGNLIVEFHGESRLIEEAVSFIGENFTIREVDIHEEY